MKQIELDGVKYNLVPVVEKEKTTIGDDIGTSYIGGGNKTPLEPNIEPTPSIGDDIGAKQDQVSTISGSGLEKAVPTEYGYKKRLEDRKLLPSDVMATPRSVSRIPEMNLDPGGKMARQVGYNPWIGEGTSVDVW